MSPTDAITAPELQQHAAAPPGVRGRRWDALAAAAYLAMSLVYAWPLVLRFGTHLAGDAGDGYQNVWNMWWFERALLSGRSPWSTDMLFHPEGVTLLFQTLNPFNAALAMPIAALFGQPVAYNTVVVFSFAASGFAMYLLARELYAGRLAAFVAGCVFTFAPYHFAHALGHLQLVAMEWFPVFVLFLVRLWRRRRVVDGVLAGLSLTLVDLCAHYYLISGLLLVLMAVAYQAMRRPRELLDRRLWLAAGAGALAFAVTGGLLVAAMIREYLRTEILPAHDSVYWSADVQSFFVPPWVSRWGESFSGVWSRWTGNRAECCQYIGYSVLALGGAGFVLRRRGERPWAWAGVALAGMLLSFGPALHWGGVIYRDIPMPYRLGEWLMPILKMSGAPIRWHFLTVFGTALLAGAGAAAIATRLSGRRLGRVPAAPAVVSLALVLVQLELMPRWIEGMPVVQPGFVQELRHMPGEWAVYDLGGPAALYRQTLHERPLVAGYVSRQTRAAGDRLGTPLLRALRGETTLAPEQVRRDAAVIGLRYVIVPRRHRGAAGMEALGLRLLRRQQGLELWEVAPPRPPAAARRGPPS